MTKKVALDALNERWRDECKCGLKKTATQPVFGDGNPNAKIVFIGEAPGKKEDEIGKPFVGTAGKFLSEMLETIKMSRHASTDGARHDFAKSDIYITNIVKYRPPNNRDPEPKEKAECHDWLVEELNIIKPKLIIFLGRHSMNDFFPTEKISNIHGKLLIKKFPNISTKHFFPLYHPAAALYNGSMRKVLIADFKKIPLILKKISKEK
ncbi:MAG: uracil-DNA glycosylase [Candidatus Paceibacterota bacterium]|jgi:DNA polymerase